MTSPDWKAKYAEIRPTYEGYEKKLRDLVGEILEHAGIDVFQVEGRVKTLDSFHEKIKRKEGKYADPLTDMTDLLGLRIIAYYLEDVGRIVELLSNEFEVRREHSMNKQDELAPDQFGYTSNHLVIRIGSRSERPEWARYADISVELQVRTMSQHAWAAMHHKLSYKRAEEVPTSLQRRLFRLSALFEMADEQFSAIKTSISELSDEYSDNVRQGNLDIEIDADSIDAYIRNSPKVRDIINVATEFKIKPIPVDGARTEHSRSRLLKVTDHLGLGTIEELDRTLPEADRTRELLTELVKVGDELLGPERERVSNAVEHDILNSMLILLHGIPKELYERVYANAWEQYAETRKRLGSRK